MTENNKYQELLEVIKRYNDDGIDYLFTNMELGNHHTGEKFEKADIYQIYSPELKKEARGLMLNGDIEDNGICRFGAQIGEKWYQYEKGNGNQPDKLEIRDISSEEKEEIRSRKEQMKRNQEELEKNRKELKQRREEWEKSFENSNGIKKCAGCGKELSPKSAKVISIKPKSAGNLEKVYFCSGSDCSANFFRERDSKKENKPDNNVPWGKKCVECGAADNGKDCWEYFIIDGKTYCGGCLDKKPKKSETELEQIKLNALKSKKIEQEQTKLNELKSKLQNSTNPTEKEILKQKIKDIENHLRKLENKKNNPNQTGSPKEGYGKIILAGVVIFLVVILVSILIAITRKRTVKTGN